MCGRLLGLVPSICTTYIIHAPWPLSSRLSYSRMAHVHIMHPFLRLSYLSRICTRLFQTQEISLVRILACSRPLPILVSCGGCGHVRCKSGLPSIPRQPLAMPPSHRHRPNLNLRPRLLTYYRLSAAHIQAPFRPFSSHHLDSKKHGLGPSSLCQVALRPVVTARPPGVFPASGRFILCSPH
ncbi:hypothetical protein CGRA01v4_12077 [Colletotrichum graminicola]|nr:hypothetical protein CGRA01v4_12077 [Colletotrichum graminicola]